MRGGKRDLTVRYGVTQFTHWLASTGAASFGATYLLAKNVPAGTVGLLMALAGLLSCVSQPLLAARADRARSCILPRMLLVMAALICVCLAAQLVPGLPLAPLAILYAVGLWSSDTMQPMLSALSVACNDGGFPVNFGAARGVAAAASALSTLAVGHLIARLGFSWMIGFLLLACGGCAVSLCTYPKLQKPQTKHTAADTSCGVGQFFARYPRYCVSLLGVAFLGMFHCMTENYLIAIVTPLGGDSSTVGTALFISSLSAGPVIFFFSRIRTRLRDSAILKIAGVSFLVKAVGFLLARSIGAIYALELLQLTSYALLAPAQVYYASSMVRPADMVKGQAFITAFYALGCAGGNFAGGQLLSHGVRAILLAGVAMAAAGTIILFCTVKRSGSTAEGARDADPAHAP